MAYFQKNQFESAIRDWKEYLRYDSEDAEVNYRIGLTYLKIDDYDNALTYLSRATELDENLGSAYYQRANLYSLQKKYLEAAKDYTKAIELGIGLDICYFNRGIAYLSENKITQAIADLEKVLEISDNEVLLTEAQNVLDLIDAEMKSKK